jgi:antitoxin MazE
LYYLVLFQYVIIMKVPVINIGNSKGIRLTKTVLEKDEIKDLVGMVLQEESILLKPLVSPRQGWDHEFGEMHSDHADELLIDDVFQDEKFEELRS